MSDKKISTKRLSWLKPLIIFAAFSLVLTVVQILISGGSIDAYITRIITLIGIYMIMAVSLNIATGYLGLLPLGHAGFMAVGAYASAILLKSFPKESAGTFLPLTIIFGGLIAAIFGVLIGIPALRLKGDYLAIITLGFGEIIRVILLNIDGVLGCNFTYGAKSLKNIPKETTFLLTFICVGISVLLIYTLIKSKHGRAILSVRDNEIAAEACGINIAFYKVFGFAFSAFLAGVAGGLFASLNGILNPSSFSFNKSIEILVMVVFGGMTMVGSLISAAVLTALPELLRNFESYRMLVYSLLLVILMIFKDSPIFANVKKTIGGNFKRIFKGKSGDRADE